MNTEQNATVNTKLLVSIVVDNSASMKGERMDKLKAAIAAFDARIRQSALKDNIEYALTTFSGFSAALTKRLSDTELIDDKLSAGGLPFVEMAVERAIAEISMREGELEAAGVPHHRSWLVLMLNGENFDPVDNAANIITERCKAGKLTYFPFALSDAEFDKSLTPMRKLKKFIVVKDAMYDNLFDWVYNVAERRITTPAAQTFGIEATSYDGWTIK